VVDDSDKLRSGLKHLENIINFSKALEVVVPSIALWNSQILNTSRLFPQIEAACKLSAQWSQTIARVALPKFPIIDTRHMFPELEAMRKVSQQWSHAFSGLQEQMRLYAPAWEAFTKKDCQCDRLDDAGWLPHSASPWHLLDDEGLCGDQLNAAVETYYQQDWPSVRATFEAAIVTYSIDEEAKATFREALAAHESGLFRCVARTIFPEIERVSRAEIHKGAMDKMASQPKLQAAISDLSLPDLAYDGILGMRLYEKLVDHMYVSIPTPEMLASVAADPVPNRHATVHGYAAYNTLRHSMNALIIAEYLFHAITIIKGLECDEGTAAAA